jgi:hypothetical protein
MKIEECKLPIACEVELRFTNRFYTSVDDLSQRCSVSCPAQLAIFNFQFSICDPCSYA